MTPFKPAVAILLIAGLVTACSSSPGPRAGGPPSRGNGGPGIDQLNQAYLKGVDLHRSGNCSAAIRRLYPVAMAGAGFEDAQRHLGECLTSTAADNQTQYLEGLLWLRRSAEAGWPEAQGALAVEYVEGPVPDLREAALWLALYNRNPRRSRPAFTPLPTEVLARLDAAIAEDLIQAGQKAADGFKIVVWKAPKGLSPSRASNSRRPEGGPGQGRGPGRKGEHRAGEPYDAASID